jgi:PAS domain S-box-containing protein
MTPSLQVSAKCIILISMNNDNFEVSSVIENLQKENAVLKQKLSQYEEMSSQMPGAVFQFTADSPKDYNFIFMSQSIERVFEKPLNQLNEYYSLIEFIHEDDREVFLSSVDDAVQKKGKWTFEYRIRLNGGERIKWLKAISNPVTDEQNRTVWNGVVLDITPLKTVEETLRVNQERYIKAQQIGRVGNWEYNLQTTEFWGSEEAKRLFGLNLDSKLFTTEEVENCIPERERVHQALVDLIEKNKEYNLEYEIIPYGSDERRIISSRAELILDEEGNPLKVAGVIQDITQRYRAEQELKKSLHDKELLIREVYHRTRNNMQVINSLLHLQARRYEDEKVDAVVLDTCQKIETISLVHEKLYQTKNLSEIILSQYFDELIGLILSSHTIHSRIQIHKEFDEIKILLDSAVPMGLVLNELLTNSLKHAFRINDANRPAGKIFISLKLSEENEIILDYRDNGPGLPPDIHKVMVKSVGFETLISIVKHQLLGTISYENDDGVHIHIVIPQLDTQARV